MIETLSYNKNHKDRQKNDFYATPKSEVYNILEREKLRGLILDPCCGTGNISKPVKDLYPDNRVIETDLIDRGCGLTGLNFLSDEYPYKTADTIIMNPPFKLIGKFVKKSLKISDKIILLARLQFLESKKRYNNIFKDYQPDRIYIYVDRITCAKNGNFEKNKSANSIAYAWFVFDKINQEKSINWIKSADY
jgi:predicted RNA methylase